MKIVVLAGGKGKRLWPYSKTETPKQFLPLFEQRSLFQITLSRWLNFCKPQDIWIVSHRSYENLLELQLEEFDPQFRERILWEPERKNTAAALCFALKCLEEKNELGSEEGLLVVPSDHLFSWHESMAEVLKRAEAIACKERLVLFGILPSRPETGYGYIQCKPEEAQGEFSLLRFVEKPSLEEAVRIFSHKDYLWNSGMLFFKPAAFWKEMAVHCPEFYSFFHSPLESIRDNFSKLPDLSLDYALLEKTLATSVIPLKLEWTDVGSWDSIYDVEKKDENGNILKGNIQALDSCNNLILASEKPVSIIGLEDILVVDTPEGLLIVKKGHSQKVKFLT